MRRRRWLPLGLLALAAPAPAAAQKAEAAATAAAAAVIDSLDPSAHVAAGLAWLDADRWDAADSAFRRAIALDPRHADAHVGLAVAQDRNRRYWEALRRRGRDVERAEQEAREALLQRGLLLDPYADIRILRFADRRRSRGDPIWFGDYATLLFFTDRAISLSLGRGGAFESLPPGLLWMHGLAAGHTGRFPLAIRALTAAVRGMARLQNADSMADIPLPTNSVRYALAVTHMRAGNRDRAFLLLREVIENDIGNYVALVQLARLHSVGSEWSQAVRAFEGAVAAAPEDPTLLRELGAALARAGRNAEAESVLAEARERHPRDPLMDFELGVVQETLGRRDAARASYERFLARAPRRYSVIRDNVRERLARL